MAASSVTVEPVDFDDLFGATGNRRVNADAIPAELRDLPRWVVWRWGEVDPNTGKRKKPPYCAFAPNRYASSTKEKTWSSFEQAIAVVNAGKADGIGLALEPPYVGVDLDDDLPPADHGAVMLTLDSYSEKSVSGTGHHVIVRANLNGHGRHPQGIGIFQTDRFFYFSGEHVTGTPTTIEDRQAELEQVLARFLPEQVQPPLNLPAVPVDLDDQELLERAFNAKNGADLRRLWDGDTSRHSGDDSAADLALCRHLAFWAGRDHGRIDKLFRSSGLMRPKWDSRRGDSTYGAGTIDKAIAATTDVYTSPKDTKGDEPHPAEARTAGWPSLREEAYHGVVGQIVRAIEPHSEADPAALLTQALAVAGNIIGRGPHFTVEADEHHPNLYVVLVGETSKGRKGSSYGHVERIGKSCDAGWADRIESGLTSGEGLIWAVRDGAGDEDEGVQDKRLLVFEPEFANVLRVLERQGNRLSSIIRDAWDGRTLRTLTRTTAAKASGAHISIVGHITADELRRYLDRTEVANGFGNRFLWICARRSKSLPEGGQMHTVNIAPLVDQLREAVRFAGTVTRTSRDDDARALWHDVYGALSEGLPGLVGAMTGRAEAQVMRLAHIYALLDQTATIRRPHLEAALAVWDYSLSSVSYVFSTALGDPLADSLLELLRQQSPLTVTRTEIRSYVGGRVGAAEIDRALALLSRYSLAHMQTLHTGGRPAEVWAYGREITEGTEQSRTEGAA